MKKLFALSMILILLALACIPLACDTGTSVPGDAVIDGEPASSLKGATIIDTTNTRNIGDATTPIVAKVFPSTSSVTTDAANLIWKASATAQTQINEAISTVNAAGGGVVLLSSGTFTCNDNILIPDTTLVLQGMGSSTVISYDLTDLAAMYAPTMLITVSDGATYDTSVTDLTIRDLKILDTDSGTTSASWGFASSGDNIGDLQSNGSIKLINVEAQNCGLKITDTTKQALIDGCYVHDMAATIRTNDAGISTNSCTGVNIVNCTVDTVYETAIHSGHCSNVVQANNTVRNSGTASGAQSVGGQRCNNISITDNSLMTKYNSIVLEDCYGDVVVTGNTMVHSDNDYTPTNAWHYDAATYTDITTAFTYHTADHYLYFGYTSKFFQVKYVMGATANAVEANPTVECFDGTSWYACKLVTDETGYATNGIPLRISGFLHFVPDGRWATATLNGVASQYWIRVKYSADLTASINVTSVQVTKYSSSGYGILCWRYNSTYDASPRAMLIANNSIRNYDYGIYVHDVYLVSVLGNTVLDSCQQGIVVSNSTYSNTLYATINNNTIQKVGIDTADMAAIVAYTKYAMVENNFIDLTNSNTAYGIQGNDDGTGLIDQGGSTIRNNIILTPLQRSFYRIGYGALVEGNTGTGVAATYQNAAIKDRIASINMVLSTATIGIWVPFAATAVTLPDASGMGHDLSSLIGDVTLMNTKPDYYKGLTRYNITSTDADEIFYIGDDAHFTIDDSTTGFTLIWVGAITDTAAERPLISKWDATGGAEKREWAWLVNADDTMRFQVYDESDDKTAYRTTDAAITMGAAPHIWMVVYAAGAGATAANNCTIYMDNAVVASTATNDAGYVKMEDLASTIRFGAYKNAAGTNVCFDGSLLFCALASKALTAMERTNIYYQLLAMIG